MTRIYLMSPRKQWYHDDLPDGWKEVSWERFEYVECAIFEKKEPLTEEDKRLVEDYGEIPDEWIEPRKLEDNTTSDELEQLEKDLADSFESFLRQEGGYVSRAAPQIAALYFSRRFQAYFHRQNINSLLDTLESEAENIADTVETEDGEYLAVDMGKLEQLINKRRIK